MTMNEKMTIDEFIELTKKDPLQFITYCELIILRSGMIILAKPCHTDAALSVAVEIEQKTKEELNSEIPDTCLPLEWFVDKHSLVAVWYSGYMYPSGGLNIFQKRTIRKLQENNLILSNEKAYIKPATEYKNYLKRKEIGIEE